MTHHLRLPLRVGPDGSFQTVAEDSDAEVIQNVTMILRTRTGERLATPDFGTPDPTFQGLDPATVLPIVQQYEPRADLDIVQQAIGPALIVDFVAVPTVYGEGGYGQPGYGTTSTRRVTRDEAVQVNDITVRRQES